MKRNIPSLYRQCAALAVLCLFALPFLLFLPRSAGAFPFGGQAATVVLCYNKAIYVYLGPPIGGPFVWTLATRTYQFGRPRHAGQWFLGLADGPYLCIVSIRDPLIIWPGTHITMMGSSQ